MEDKKEDEWKKVEIEYEEDEQIMLEIGETIEGLFERKFSFTNDFGQSNFGYIIRVKGDKVPKLLFGSKVLNDRMANVPEGHEVKIERLKDQKTKNNPNTKFYDVYWK